MPKKGPKNHNYHEQNLLVHNLKSTENCAEFEVDSYKMFLFIFWHFPNLYSNALLKYLKLKWFFEKRKLNY